MTNTNKAKQNHRRNRTTDKTTPPPAAAIDLDGDDTAPPAEDPNSSHHAPSDEPAAAEDTRPTYPELLDGAKTKTTGGEGTGGRTWVCCETRGQIDVREPRAGDESRPQCPNCSTDDVAVLCGAKSSPSAGHTATTYYYCPVPYCNHSIQKLRPQVASAVLSRHRGGGKPAPQPHITRPS